MGTTQLRLPLLSSLLSSPRVAAAGHELDLDELECLCAVLIARKFVRGYVSHTPPVLVLAKDKPFPRIGDVV
jgi:hypothetical protein